MGQLSTKLLMPALQLLSLWYSSSMWSGQVAERAHTHQEPPRVAPDCWISCFRGNKMVFCKQTTLSASFNHFIRVNDDEVRVCMECLGGFFAYLSHYFYCNITHPIVKSSVVAEIYTQDTILDPVNMHLSS